MLTMKIRCLAAAVSAVLLGMALSMDVGDDAPVPTDAPLYHHAGLNLSVWVVPQGVRTVQQADSGNAATGAMSAADMGLEGGLGVFLPANPDVVAPARPDTRMLQEPLDGMGQGRFSPDRGFDSRVSWD